MKKLILTLCVALFSMGAYAQVNLAGRVYHCANLVEKEMLETKKEVANVDTKGMSEEEKKEVESEKKAVDALMKAISSTMTLKFIDSKTVEVSVVMKFDEAKAKQEGASWMLRKLAKMKLGKGTSKKGTSAYTVNGRKVLVTSTEKKKENKTMTFELSEDGKSMDYITTNKKGEKSKVVLKRTK